MFKTLIAGLTALSLSLAPGPATATGLSEDELGQLLFGLVAAGIIGKVIHDNRNREVPAQQTQHLPRHAPVERQQPRGQQHWQGSNVLPSACIRQFDTQRGPQRIFGARCLNNRYHDVRSLPAACEIRLRTYDGPRTGYDPRCLRDYGYRSDQR